MNALTSSTGERWRRRIDRQTHSRLSVSAFCRRHSLAVATFYFWKRRLRLPEHTSAFVEVRQPPTSDAASSAGTLIGTHRGIHHRGIQLCLRGGRRLRLQRGFDRQLLLDLLSVLEGES
jgi:hypothetical protein